VRRHILIFLVFTVTAVPTGELRAQAPAFAETFGKSERQAMESLIRGIDKKAAKSFRKLKGSKQAVFLYQFWDRHSPDFSRNYVDFQLGQRRPNASPLFYNDSNFLTPDYWVHAPPLDSDAVNDAIVLCHRLLDENPDDGVAHLALGYCLLEADSLQLAEASFVAARKRLRKEPSVYNGLGLAWVKREKSQTVARDFFRDALALDREYEAASYNLAMSQIATRATDVPFHIRKVTRAFPDHHDAYYKLGVWHEIRSRFAGEFVEEAMAAYQTQTEVNPVHYAAWSNLARMKMRTGGHAEAVLLCKRVLEAAAAYRVRVLPVLMEAYQALGRIAEADAAATRYVSMLDQDTRRLFEDISLVSSRKEKRMLDELQGAEREAFVHDYWLRNDPSPGTPENEKRVEHVRRVGNAMVLYSEAVKPWDTRGDVYVRYGDPQHKSRSDNLRFEIDRRVVTVRDRLLASLSDEERNEIRQFHRRIRTSSRDVEKVIREDGVFRINVSDFEPAEFGMDPAAGDARLGNPDPNEKNYQTGLIESINDRIAPVDIRGIPLFPVEGNRPWEYWVYTDVGDGIEVVFSAYNQHGGFGFAQPPQMGRKMSRHNQRTFIERSPDNVIARVITRQPSLLRLNVAPMAFVYDTADFRGNGGLSRAEVYLGRVCETEDTVYTDAAIILYDKSWNLIAESRETFRHAGLDEADSLATMTFDVGVPPGDYILAIQVGDTESGKMGGQRMGVQVEAYPDSVLALSDLTFGSKIVEDPEASRGGVRVTPHPWRRYAGSDPVSVYYEIYGLTNDAFGQTRYQMDYQITPLDGGSLVAKVIRGFGQQLGIDKRETWTISYDRVGEEKDEYGFVEIDVSGSAQGPYELMVTVTDLETGSKASKRRAFSIRGAEDTQDPVRD
jgi:GWxTD domain-containing protein